MPAVSNPLVSICIPTFNRADSLRETLDDVCGHDYEPVEIIISDNGSTDNTEEICRARAEADPRIQYIRHPQGIGLYQNHNCLLDVCRGEFICFVHDHDTRVSTITPDYVTFMMEHPEVGVVCSDWDVIDQEGVVLGHREYQVPEIIPGLTFIEQTIRSGRSSIGVPGAMIRRSALGDTRFDEQGPLGFGDFEVWFRVAERTSIGHLKRRLWAWRQEPNAQSVRTIASLVGDYDKVITTYCDGYARRWPTERPRTEHWKRLARRYIFWALAYEVGLHFKRRQDRSASPTLFEILPYRLSESEFGQVLDRMQEYQAGLDQAVARLLLRVFLWSGFTWPLGWITRHYASMRILLGLR
jgi:glycosyltransferase involved in cell wall biosynthesis